MTSDISENQPPVRQRFRSLAESIPTDVNDDEELDMPFNIFSYLDPTDEGFDTSIDDVVGEDNVNGRAELKNVVDWGARDDTPVKKFRRIARAITVQNRWTKKFTEKIADEEQMKKVKEMEDIDVLTFNPKAFSKSNTQQKIPLATRWLLCKSVDERTEDDLQTIFKTVSHLTIFKKFPILVQKELTRYLHFESFEDGRIIIQQDQPSISLYFVLKGAVAVEVKTLDKNTGKTYKQIVNEIMSGGMFGEKALMSGMVRAGTIICIGASEFIRIDKDDFKQVLMRSFHKEWEKKTLFMKDCILFKDWMYKAIRAAAATSFVKEYTDNKVIVRDLSLHHGNVFIVLSGTCLAVTQISVIKERPPYCKENMRMIPLEDSRDPNFKLMRYQKKEEVFLAIRKLHEGDCFGIGEQLPQTSIISESKVKVLSVPIVHILRHGRGHALERIQEAEMNKYPTLENAFSEFQDRMIWKYFKTDIQEEIISKKLARRQ